MTSIESIVANEIAMEAETMMKVEAEAKRAAATMTVDAVMTELKVVGKKITATDAEKRQRASEASKKSRAKRLAGMTPEQLVEFRKKASEASKRSVAKRIAAMTPEQVEAFKRKAAEASKRSRENKKQRELAAVV